MHSSKFTQGLVWTWQRNTSHTLFDSGLLCSNEIEQAFGDYGESKHAEVLNSLLVSTKKRGRLHLKSFDEIKAIYEDNARMFDLGRFQDTFLKLIRRWSEMVLPVAELAKLGYGSIKPTVAVDNKENISCLGSAFATKATNQQRQQKKRRIHPATSEPDEDEEEEEDGHNDGEGQKEDNLDRLKRTREALMKNVEDPLNDCLEKAKSARTRFSGARHVTAESESTVSTPNFLKKKKSAYKVAFSDSEDDDNAKGNVEEGVETEEEEQGVKLSKVPEPFKPDVGPKKIEVSKTTKPKQGKRFRFTDSEDAALRSGIERFGVGRWADIKSYYHIDLANRSAVQIKDRWRTLQTMNNREERQEC